MNTINQMKNIIVLKDLPSNIIEEAFVILKANTRIKSLKSVENNIKESNQAGENAREYIVKEAEMVINNYLSNMETENKIRSRTIKQIENKYKRLKRITIFLSSIIAINMIIGLLGI